MEQREIEKAHLQGHRMGKPLGQSQSIAAAFERGIGIAQQPFNLTAHIAGAGPRIVPAIKLAMSAMPLGIVNPATRQVVHAAWCDWRRISSAAFAAVSSSSRCDSRRHSRM